jgi:hypothetical protein
VPDRDPSVRLTRLCEACGQIDDHPHHIVAHASGPTDLHMDCCAARGCDVCAAALEAHGHAKGADLLASIQKGA